MKKNLILAAITASAVVGLSACGTNTPAAQHGAQPFPREKQCQDVPRPTDPSGLLAENWHKDDSCLIFNMNNPGPGVDTDQAARIVFDARMKALAGKRDLVMLVQQGTKQANNPTGVETDFKGAIAQRREAIKAELTASGLALQGRAPEGFRIEYLKNADASNSHVDDGPHSASPGLAPGK